MTPAVSCRACLLSAWGIITSEAPSHAVPKAYQNAHPRRSSCFDHHSPSRPARGDAHKRAALAEDAFRYFWGSVGDWLVSDVAALVSWWTSMLMPMAPRIKSTTTALAIHIMRISRLSSFCSGMAHALVCGRRGDIIAEGPTGVNCDNYQWSRERDFRLPIRRGKSAVPARPSRLLSERWACDFLGRCRRADRQHTRTVAFAAMWADADPSKRSARRWPQRTSPRPSTPGPTIVFDENPRPPAEGRPWTTASSRALSSRRRDWPGRDEPCVCSNHSLEQAQIGFGGAGRVSLRKLDTLPWWGGLMLGQAGA